MTQPEIAWRPHPGPQTLLISCPIEDILCGGARGGGKTQGMLARWIRRQAQYGAAARGVWFRRSIPEIEGAQVEMLKLFPLVGAQYEAQARTWRFPSGATLKLRYLESDTDAYRYVGHEYTDLFFDDVGTWPSPAPIDMLRGTLRSPAGVPCSMVSSANPAGPGHAWLKARYLTPSPPMVPFIADGIRRVFIPSTIKDNPSIGGAAREQYLAQLRLAGPEHLVRAWIEGDWDVEPGGAMLDPEWLRHYWENLPDRKTPGARITVSVDPAEDIGAKNDETAIVIGMHAGYHVHLLHAEAVKLLLEPLEARLGELCEAYRPHRVIVEKKSVGGPLVQNLKRKVGWRWPTEAIDPGPLSKAERLWRVAPWFSGGRVLLPAPRIRGTLPTRSDWDSDDGFVREMVRFTGDKKLRERDNRVDATSQLLHSFDGGGNLRALYTA